MATIHIGIDHIKGGDVWLSEFNLPTSNDNAGMFMMLFYLRCGHNVVLERDKRWAYDYVETER